MDNIIENLVESLKVFNGVGEKTARRYAYELLDVKPNEREQFIASLNALENIKHCKKCYNYSIEDFCSICESTRNSEILIIVETPREIAILENVLNSKYYYHVLGGIINPMKDISANDLNIDSLKQRIAETSEIKEIILVLPTTIEGELSANYLKELFADQVKVTKLAQGIPIGGNLEYVDELTLMRSLEGRR